jgi:hypothetical protein
MNTFLNKVQAERRVLSTINSYTPGKLQLRGLSSNAITNWASANNIGFESHLIATITGLGDLCGSLSDRSNESFNRIPIERISRIEEQLQVLTNHLECLTKPSSGRAKGARR